MCCFLGSFTYIFKTVPFIEHFRLTDTARLKLSDITLTITSKKLFHATISEYFAKTPM